MPKEAADSIFYFICHRADDVRQKPARTRETGEKESNSLSDPMLADPLDRIADQGFSLSGESKTGVVSSFQLTLPQRSGFDPAALDLKPAGRIGGDM